MENMYEDCMFNEKPLFDDDAILMRSVIGSDYELLVIDCMLREAFSKEVL